MMMMIMILGIRRLHVCLFVTSDIFSDQPQNATVFSAIAMQASNSSSILEVRLRMPGEEELVSVYKDSELFSLSAATSQLSGTHEQVFI